MNSHAHHDRFSLLLHREVASALHADASLLGKAHDIVTAWKRHNPSAPTDWDEWLCIIEQGLPATIQTMVAEDERSTRLRQSSPFSVLVPARKRWALLKVATRE